MQVGTSAGTCVMACCRLVHMCAPASSASRCSVACGSVVEPLHRRGRHCYSASSCSCSCRFIIVILKRQLTCLFHGCHCRLRFSSASAAGEPLLPAPMRAGFLTPLLCSSGESLPVERLYTPPVHCTYSKLSTMVDLEETCCFGPCRHANV